jgi:hypothetical protein
MEKNPGIRKMPKPRKTLWRPGQSPYAEFLKSLTPEEHAEHLKERANRRTMKKAFEQVVHEYQSQWIAKINNAMVAVIDRAIATGDPACLIAVHDRIIGRPIETINTDSNKILPWNDNVDVTRLDDDAAE